MKILLVSGHGAGDSGACAKIGGKQYKESDETITMVKKIKSAFGNYNNVEVTLYPTERNMYEDIKAGKCQVKLSNYDYMLEIHFNACVNDLKGNGKTTGTEIYIPKSGSVTLEDNIVANIAKLGLKNRGTKKYNWTCIYHGQSAGCKSALLEICFIDDADDMKLYNANKANIATAVVNAFVKQYNLKKKTTKATTTSTTLREGSKVKIKSGAKDANTGKKYSDFVYKTVYVVQKVVGDYVVFGLNNVATGKTLKSNCTLQ